MLFLQPAPVALKNKIVQRLAPRSGVYACLATMNGRTWKAVTNIGVRPTFETRPVAARIETHLLDCASDLYGQEITLDFIARLRDEMRFPGVQALLEQIQVDIRQARKTLRLPPGKNR